MKKNVEKKFKNMFEEIFKRGCSISAEIDEEGRFKATCSGSLAPLLTALAMLEIQMLDELECDEEWFTEIKNFLIEEKENE